MRAGVPVQDWYINPCGQGEDGQLNCPASIGSSYHCRSHTQRNGRCPEESGLWRSFRSSLGLCAFDDCDEVWNPGPMQDLTLTCNRRALPQPPPPPSPCQDHPTEVAADDPESSASPCRGWAALMSLGLREEGCGARGRPDTKCDGDENGGDKCYVCPLTCGECPDPCEDDDSWVDEEMTLNMQGTTDYSVTWTCALLLTSKSHAHEPSPAVTLMSSASVDHVYRQDAHLNAAELSDCAFAPFSSV